MTKLIRDPELDQLVKDLNRTNAPAEAEASPWPAAQVPAGNPIEPLLTEMARRGASDLLILAGSPPIFRIDGRLLRADSPSLEHRRSPPLFAPRYGRIPT
jgi:hypothetical protein